MSDERNWPSEIRLNHAEKTLEVTFEDGASFSLPAELLRVESPSAELRGHSPSDKQILGGRRHVGIMRLEEIGNYAIRIVFDDLHDTGIFTWEFLRELGETQSDVWNIYLRALQEKGLSRDPERRK